MEAFEREKEREKIERMQEKLDNSNGKTNITVMSHRLAENIR